MHALKPMILFRPTGSTLATLAVVAGSFAPAAAQAHHRTNPSTSTREEGEG